MNNSDITVTLETVSLFIQCGHVNKVCGCNVHACFAALMSVEMKHLDVCFAFIISPVEVGDSFKDLRTRLFLFSFINLYMLDVRALLLSNNCALGVIVCVIVY